MDTKVVKNFEFKPGVDLPSYGELLDAFMRVTDDMQTAQKMEYYTGESQDVCERILAVKNRLLPHYNFSQKMGV